MPPAQAGRPGAGFWVGRAAHRAAAAGSGVGRERVGEGRGPRAGDLRGEVVAGGAGPGDCHPVARDEVVDRRGCGRGSRGDAGKCIDRQRHPRAQALEIALAGGPVALEEDLGGRCVGGASGPHGAVVALIRARQLRPILYLPRLAEIPGQSTAIRQRRGRGQVGVGNPRQLGEQLQDFAIIDRAHQA